MQTNGNVVTCQVINRDALSIQMYPSCDTHLVPGDELLALEGYVLLLPEDEVTCDQVLGRFIVPKVPVQHMTLELRFSLDIDQQPPILLQCKIADAVERSRCHDIYGGLKDRRQRSFRRRIRTTLRRFES